MEKQIHRTVAIEYWDKGEFVPATGTFHGWGNSVVEDDKGYHTFTVAIVELPCGKVVKAVPEEVTFTDK